MRKIVSINPATGEVNKEFEPHSQEEIDLMIKGSRSAFQQWKNLDVCERVEYLEKVSKILRRDKEDFGRTITMEMGKPFKQAVAEVEKAAVTFDYYVQNAERFMEPESVETDAISSGISFEPMGTVLSIKPWNFPFWQVLSSAAHILAGGNVMLLKHSSYVPICAIEMESVFRDAGVPDGVFQTLMIDGRTASDIISRDEINAVSFTGGYPAGQKVAEAAARNMKKCVLELGGSDPFIVLDGADIEKAAKVGVPTRFLNAGQTCISPKRFIVAESVAEEFTSLFVELTQDLKVGDPMDKDTYIGPMVRKEQADILVKQVENTLSAGARELLEGGRADREGAFCLPMVLDRVTTDMTVLREETFGPVAPIITFKEEDEAVRIANDCELGLAASVWSEDREKAEQIAHRLETGMVAVNAFFRPEPNLPFGGVKKSGIGRELSRFGFYEFMNIKSMKIY